MLAVGVGGTLEGSEMANARIPGVTGQAVNTSAAGGALSALKRIAMINLTPMGWDGMGLNY